MTSLQVMYYFGYAETFTIPSDRSGMVAICFFFFFVAPAAIRAGSKMGCVELCDFNFCCASIFCQPMKKFEFSGATRATRQRHSKMSSTGDEDALNLSSIKIRRPQLPTMLSSSRFVRMLTR